MRQLAPTFGISIVIAFLTIGIAFLPNPEAQTRVSADGLVTLSGLSRQSQALSLEATDDVFALPLLGPAYDVGPSGLTLDRPFTLVFALRDVGVATDELGVFRYRDDLGFWTPVVDTLMQGDDTLSIVTAWTGRYALGVRQHLETPVFLTTYDSLRAMAPRETVGYVIHVGYRMNDGPTVLLPVLSEVGGCGGMFGEGDIMLDSETLREANVLVDDVTTAVTFIFHGVWTTAAGGSGCAEDESLQPLLGA
ncbi:MAG: hypothetical protein NUV56_04915 [Candidatus Uhrbacteria bacterium]|nr:hypothetical protein [Candidatus Uhrbacteria bacterium]